MIVHGTGAKTTGSHGRSMPLQSIVQKARGWREFLVTFQRELDGEHVSHNMYYTCITHVMNVLLRMHLLPLLGYIYMILHVSFMVFSWGECQTRHFFVLWWPLQNGASFESWWRFIYRHHKSQAWIVWMLWMVWIVITHVDWMLWNVGVEYCGML